MHVLGVIAAVTLGQTATFPAVILEATWSCAGSDGRARQELVATPDTTPRLEVPVMCGGPSHAELRLRCAEACVGTIESGGARIADLSLAEPQRLFSGQKPLPVTVTVTEKRRGASWLGRLRLVATPLGKVVVQREEVFSSGPLELGVRTSTRSARYVVTPGEPVLLSSTRHAVARVIDVTEASANVELASRDSARLRLRLPVGAGRATVPCAAVGWDCAGSVELTLSRTGARVQR